MTSRHASYCKCDTCGGSVAGGTGPIYSIIGLISSFFSAIGVMAAYSATGLNSAFAVDGCAVAYVVGDFSIINVLGVGSIIGDCIIGDAVMGA